MTAIEDIAAAIGFRLPARYNASRLLFDNLAAGRAENTAVFCASGDFTYAELAALANRVGRALLARGLQPGARVAMFLDDTPVYPAAVMGALKAGLVPVLLNTASPPDLVRFFLEDSTARAAIVDAAFQHLFSPATLAGTGCALLLIANGAAEIPGAQAWDTVSSQPPDLDEAPTTPRSMALWMYSSGSTGRPKGVVHRHADPAYTAHSYARHILKLGPADICFSVPRIFFAYGFGNSVTFPFAAGGASVLLPGRPTPDAVFAQVARYRPTVFFALPTLYTALIKDPAAARADFSSVRLCVSAAEILSGDVFDAWQRRFGQRIVEGLGSTEVLHIYLSNTAERQKSGAAGQPVPGYAVQLRDAAGAPAAAGEEGVAWVGGTSNALQYWNRPEKTAETMREGWIHTGDRFTRDAEGFYYFRGRTDDLVKVSGQWVYPLEVELALAEHPRVRECAVLAVTLADRRTTLRAFVVPEGDGAADGILSRALQDWVKARLLPYKYPREVRYLASLPKTGTGKIDRRALAEQA